MQSLKRILLVEDDSNDMELTMTALQGSNIANEIDVVRDGEQALDYLYRRDKFQGREGGNPVVVLLDLKLPKVDGIEVLRQIKSNEQLKTTPVVILTSSREDRDMVETYKLGVNAYVVKPVDFSAFVDARQVPRRLLGGP
jgi:DNA-binding response OmpR family regulator